LRPRDDGGSLPVVFLLRRPRKTAPFLAKSDPEAKGRSEQLRLARFGINADHFANPMQDDGVRIGLQGHGPHTATLIGQRSKLMHCRPAASTA
jgi:hypothetical protein